jgi:hypothetical protein
MAEVGIDMGENDVEKKCVPVLSLPVALRGGLGSSKVSAELGRSGPRLVGAADFHGVVPPLSIVMTLSLPVVS